MAEPDWAGFKGCAGEQKDPTPRGRRQHNGCDLIDPRGIKGAFSEMVEPEQTGDVGPKRQQEKEEQNVGGLGSPADEHDRAMREGPGT